MSWDKNTISFSEVDAFLRFADIFGADYQLIELAKVRGRGLNDDPYMSGEEKLYPIRRVEFKDKVILEYMERHSDCDADDIIRSCIYDKAQVPLEWQLERHIDDECPHSDGIFNAKSCEGCDFFNTCKEESNAKH